ncbi:SCO1/SenC-domain-containing protein [Radiomyces spectabilis]|uniref:SCO1/SenC-domain-containing protein n=1 Tax=Radiomyces spectabilis TaxID=64574 RepID=UPI00221F73AC|nr:SCO1/SenC-domain-containing protein [Radiomyces spectabilis]KAI8388357.1 SCO1/SenC-domain-containing protein [Radiomyces spectabilis]
MFLGTGTGLLWYFQSEKARVQEEREKEQNKPKAYGKPKLGGPFSLTNAETGGKLGTDDLNGRFYMIYFGFTHCPDICPEELDKMAEVVDAVKADKDMGEGVLIPVFITCDPRRDTPEIVKEYVKDFHDDLIGLTGNEEEIRRVAKLFRVYVSSPPNLEEGQEDYLVDHSIFFYLMSPDGTFLDCYSQNATSEDVTESFKNYYQEYKAKGGQLDKKPASLLQKKA